VKRSVALLALLVLGAAVVAWFGTSRDDGPPSPRVEERKRIETPAPPRPRRREPTEVPAPTAAPATSSEQSPVERPAKPATPAERKFLGGSTAKELVAPFADVERRPGRTRFREDMVSGAAWTQLSDIVDEDYDFAVESFTRGFLATIEKNGAVVGADARRRFAECEKSYWRVTVDLQQRAAALNQKVLDRDYRDDDERGALEVRFAQIAGITERLNRERIEQENSILAPAPR
jgi:hypothetical protein